MSGNTSIHAVDDTNTLDNGKVKWVPVKANPDGSLNVAMQATSTWAYGSWPADSYLEHSGTGTGDNTVLFTSGDLSSYNIHMIQASAGLVDAEVSLDGTTYSPAASIALEDMSSIAPTTRVLVTASTNVYMLRGKYKNIRLVQNGATAATAVLVSGVM